MAFSSFANNGTGGAFGSGGSVSGPNSDTPAPLDSQFGPELPEITTEVRTDRGWKSPMLTNRRLSNSTASMEKRS